MDGALAAIFAIASLTDMAFNDCPTGCLAPQDAPASLSFQLGDVQFQDKSIGTEIYIRRAFGFKRGPFQPTIGAAITDTGDLWIGAGSKWTSTDIASGPFFVTASLMPGAHFQGDGPDLGGVLQFRASLGAGYTFDNGGAVTVSYDHRSNADTQDINPGLEVLSISYAIPF